MDTLPENINNEYLMRENHSAKTAIVILGMHRSGTSAMTGVVVALGAKPPATLMPEHDTNPKGFFESVPIMLINDRVLAALGSNWNDWRALNRDWYSTDACAALIEEAKQTLLQEYGGGSLIAVKDPRMCRIFPFWIRVFDSLGYKPKIIIPIRSPLEVAASLKQRDRFPTSKSLLIWLRHVLDAELSTRGLPRSIVRWSDLLNDWQLVTSEIGMQLDTSWPALSDRVAAKIDRFLTESLRHSSFSADRLQRHPIASGWIYKVYEAMLALADNPQANQPKAVIDRVNREFTKASNIFGRALLDLEEGEQNIRAELAEKETVLSRVSSERDHALSVQADLSSQLHTETAARDSLSQELQSLRDQLHAVSIDRDAIAQQLSNSTHSHDNLVQTVNSLEEQIGLITHEYNAARDEIDKLSGERLHLTRQVEQVNAELEMLSNECVAARDQATALSAEREYLLSKLTQLEAELEHSNIDRNAAHTRADLLNQETDRLTFELLTLRDESETQVLILKSELARSEEDRLKAENDSRFLKSEVETLQSALREAADHSQSALEEEQRKVLIGRQELQQKLHLAEEVHAKALTDMELRHSTEKASIRRTMETDLTYKLAACGRDRLSLLKRIALFLKPNRDAYIEIASSALFDQEWYLETYRDVASAGMDAVEHYINHSSREGRNPGPNFDSKCYLEANPDVQTDGVNPLLHFLRFGRHERRPLSL